jgi:drug/metabolite transporter (DMT)-like permease
MILTLFTVFLRIFSIPLGNVFQKQLAESGNHPLLINFTVYLILAVISLAGLPMIIRSGAPFDFWLYSVTGGILGALGNGYMIKALQKGDLSILGPVNSYKSVVGIILGVFLLGEIPNLYGISGIILIVYGSYFVLDTTKERFSLKLFRNKEIQYRIIAMALTGTEAIFMKKVILVSSPLMSAITWCWFGCLFSFIFLFIFGVKVSAEFHKISFLHLPKYLYLVICIGVMTFCTNFVFDRMPVGYALSLFQLSAIVSILFGYRIFNETNIRKKLVGSVIMIIGSIVIIMLGK